MQLWNLAFLESRHLGTSQSWFRRVSGILATLESCHLGIMPSWNLAILVEEGFWEFWHLGTSPSWNLSTLEPRSLGLGGVLGILQLCSFAILESCHLGTSQSWFRRVSGNLTTLESCHLESLHLGISQSWFRRVSGNLATLESCHLGISLSWNLVVLVEEERGTTFSQLPCAAISTVDHPLVSTAVYTGS